MLKIALILLLVSVSQIVFSAPLVHKIVIHKKHRMMEVLFTDKTVKSYPISLGFSPKGHKQKQGDGKTPEGQYVIDFKKKNSQFHRALRISYPNEQDREKAKKLGMPPGGDIMIHGLPNRFGWVGKKHLLSDWTRGCVALTNTEIDKLFAATPVNTPVLILP